MSLDFDSARLSNPNLRPEHEEWRNQLRRFIDTEIMPHANDWDEEGHIPIELGHLFSLWVDHRYRRIVDAR